VIPSFVSVTGAFGVAFTVAIPVVFAVLIAVTVKVYSVSFVSELKVQVVVFFESVFLEEDSLGV
jgi:hypothetical protein